MRRPAARRVPVCWVALIVPAAVNGVRPECSVVLHFREKEAECGRAMALGAGPNTTGCKSEWDGVNCWPPSPVGEVVSLSCPQPLLNPALPSVPVVRNCTSHGWSSPSLPYYEACHFEDSAEDTGDKKYLAVVKVMYTVGYAASLASLISACLLFCIFRKLLCTRTYIHLNLFSSFILRGTAVFFKDAVLFADEDLDHCSVSTVTCKAAVVLFQYCVLANFFWLLVEGLYLQTLLIFSYVPEGRLLCWCSLTGWGTPFVTTGIWMLFKSLFDNRGCWDDVDSALWWIIKAPILCSVLVNFVVFVNVIRIIFQKIKSSCRRDQEGPPYLRLAKSTLLLIPLFGVHYVVFALFPAHVGLRPRLCFELVLGSFQGAIVAFLYCFLNGEVQHEVKKQMQRFVSPSEDNAVNMEMLDYTA